ncbi:MAG: hypothetical protein ABH881_00675 [bacterium]
MIKFLNKKQNEILKEVFYVLTGALVVFSFMEIMSPGIILAYLNINWVLILWLVVGIIIIL